MYAEGGNIGGTPAASATHICSYHMIHVACSWNIWVAIHQNDFMIYLWIATHSLKSSVSILLWDSLKTGPYGLYTPGGP